MFELRVAGAPSHTQRRASWSWLCDQGVLLAEKGYIAVINAKGNPSRGLELRRSDGKVLCSRFTTNGLDPANDPAWMDQAEKWVHDHLRRRNLL